MFSIVFFKTRSLLQKSHQVPQESKGVPTDYFIYCLEAVHDRTSTKFTETQKRLELLTMEYGVASIYNTCDTIEGLESNLHALVLDDHQFNDYEIIYLVMTGEANTICLNDYHYSLQEIAEIFEGKLNGKILHFSNAKVLDLEAEEAQYFLDMTGARAISGYGRTFDGITSAHLDMVFFHLFEEDDNMLEVVEALHQKHYKACKLLDFRMYY